MNKLVESYWHYGFEKVFSIPPIGVGQLKTPPVTLKAFYIPSGKQVVEEAVEEVVKATGLDVNFSIGQPDEVETAIIHGALNFGITDVGQISYILATAKHESDNFNTIFEYGKGGYCGNSNDYDGFAGVGLVQLTWKGNYKKQKNKLRYDHLSAEEFCKLMSEQPDLIITVLIGGMMDGDFTGYTLPEFVAGDNRDYVNARRVVNGVDRAYRIADIAEGYEDMVERTLEDYGVIKK